MMLRSVKKLRGYKIRATDGYIGKVHEFYFDDETWLIRYLIVNTGRRNSKQLVLISPAVLGEPDWINKELPVMLTKGEVANSPSIDMDKPVSRQYYSKLNKHYEWPIFWNYSDPDMQSAAIIYSRCLDEKEPGNDQTSIKGDPHLRSTREVIGYYIQATDNRAGHIEDFIIDDETWEIRHIVVNTHKWIPDKKVLISPKWVEEIQWAESKIYVALPRKAIKESPEFDPLILINQKYDAVLRDYNCLKHWIRAP